MPLVSRAGLRNVFVQACEPGDWNQGCVWSDTDNADFFKNVCGTATQIGGSVGTDTTVMAFNQVAGCYSSPSTATASSSAAASCSRTESNASNTGTFSDTSSTTAVKITGLSSGDSVLQLGIRIASSAGGGCVRLGAYTCACCCPAVKLGCIAGVVSGCADTWLDLTLACSFSVPANGNLWIAQQHSNGSDTFRSSCVCSPQRKQDSCRAFACGLLCCYVVDATVCNNEIRTSVITVGPGSAIDCNNCTRWQSNCEATPRITVDTGAANNLNAVMVRRNAADTTTTITVEAGCNACGGCCPTTVRTITSSNLTAGADRFVRFNSISARFVTIRESGVGNSVSSYTNIKVFTRTNTELVNSSGRLAISSTDTSLGLCGT